MQQKISFLHNADGSYRHEEIYTWFSLVLKRRQAEEPGYNHNITNKNSDIESNWILEEVSKYVNNSKV